METLSLELECNFAAAGGEMSGSPPGGSSELGEFAVGLGRSEVKLEEPSSARVK